MRINSWIYLVFLLLLWSCDDEPIVSPPADDSLEDIAYDPQAVILDIGNPLFPILEIPDDNPLTVEGIDLGRHLFFDPILSIDSTTSCASCHLQQGSFTDNKAFSNGVGGIEGKRSSMSLLNVGFNNRGLFWDGRVMTLEEQALLPIEDPLELQHQWPDVIEDLINHEQYPEKFRKAFGITNKSEITKELAAKAIAQFERSLISSKESRFDRILMGLDVFSDEERLGFEMFTDFYQGNNPDIPDAQCFHCHDQPLFTNNDYENNGLDFIISVDDFIDQGLGGITGIQGDKGRFRVPTLRNIEFTAPYMHDGRFETLDEVIDHYVSGGFYSPTKSAFLDSINLDNTQKQALKAFLLTLSDQKFLENPDFSNPF